MESPVSPLSVAARFALIIGGLRAAVAARIGYYAVTGPMILYICNRLNKINQQFQALAALILAGNPPAERVYRPRAAREAPLVPPPNPEAGAGREFFPMWRWVPTHRFGWLCMIAPNWAGPLYASVWGAALRSLLADPEMVALLAATPRMGKLLRPLCWALGIKASLPRPRRMPRNAPAAAVAAVVTEGDENVSPGGTAETATVARDKPSSTPPVAGGRTPECFAPA